MNIDLERVISDPAYRRTVLDYLRNEADDKAARGAAPAQAAAAAASPKQSAPAK